MSYIAAKGVRVPLAVLRIDFIHDKYKNICRFLLTHIIICVIIISQGGIIKNENVFFKRNY